MTAAVVHESGGPNSVVVNAKTAARLRGSRATKPLKSAGVKLPHNADDVLGFVGGHVPILAT
jgi:hypothetical protein